MNRYFSSFIITTFIYASLIAGTVVFMSQDNTFSDKKIDKPNVISVNMISQPKTPNKPIKKKVVQKKKKIVKKKPVKKKVVKKVVKKDTLPKKIEPKPVEEIIEKEVLEEEPIVQESSNTEVKQHVIATKKPEVYLDEIQAKQNIFFTKIRNRIDQNKTYPRSARRRKIEGDVEVSFNLCSDGNVKNIEFLSGNSIFKKSIIKAIKKSFPIEVDKSLFNYPKDFTITLAYTLTNID